MTYTGLFPFDNTGTIDGIHVNSSFTGAAAPDGAITDQIERRSPRAAEAARRRNLSVARLIRIDDEHTDTFGQDGLVSTHPIATRCGGRPEMVLLVSGPRCKDFIFMPTLLSA